MNIVQFFAPFYDTNSKEIEKYLPLAIAIELCMFSAYKTNIILDEKKEIWKEKEMVKSTHLESHLTISCIEDLLKKYKNFPKEQLFFLELISEIKKNIQLGFLYEKKLIIDSGYNSESFEIDYLKRNIYLNKVYDYATLIGYYCVSGKNLIKIYDKLIQKPFSYSGQIINDLSDFSNIIDENVKSYQDNFSDLKNNIVTLPIHILLQKNNKKEIFFNKNMSNLDNQKIIFSIIVENNIPEILKKITVSSYNELTLFWKKYAGFEKDSYTVRTYHLLKDNKYFRKFSI